MRKSFLLLIITLLFISMGASCNSEKQQTQLKTIRAEIKKIKNMPYIPELSGDQIFWELVKKKIEIVPDLIELLSDSTQTDAVVPNFGGFYSVGDIAYFIIAEIIHGTPTRSFVPQKSEDEGFYYYWNYLRSDYSNRVQFKQSVSNWFEENKNNFKWVDDSMKYKTSSDWKYPTSFHPSGGYYKIKD